MKAVCTLLFLLLAGVIFNLGLGTAAISYGEIIRMLFNFSPNAFTEHEAIIFLIRMPRIVLAVLVGGALGTAGCVMQGLYRNPMADPSIIGISSGATLGAVSAIFFSIPGLYTQPFLAVTGGVLVAFLVLRLAVRQDKIQMMTLLLAGIAVSTFLSAVTSLMLSFCYEYQLKQFLFWTIGGLDGANWHHIHLIIVPIISGVIFLCFYACELNLLNLGEEEAQSLGLNPTKTRSRLLIASSLVTALAVSVSGTIGFVGLIIPHILRLLVGSDHRLLLPVSALGGSVFLLYADLIARTVFPLGEIRVGIVTALIGAPYFLYLLLQNRKGGLNF